MEYSIKKKNYIVTRIVKRLQETRSVTETLRSSEDEVKKWCEALENGPSSAYFPVGEKTEPYIIAEEITYKIEEAK